MDFRLALEHYRSGIPSDQERELVERELEKSQLIAEYLDEQWNSPPPETDDSPADEVGMIHRILRRKDRRTILTSVALTMAVLIVVICVAVPVAERFFWNPAEMTHTQTSTDLALTLKTYTELFLPGRQVRGVLYGRTGFATYDLSISIYDQGRGSYDRVSGTLNRGRLSLDHDFYEFDPGKMFYGRILEDWEKEDVRLTLAELPEYMRIEAAVLFPQDLTTAQIQQFVWDHGTTDSEYPVELNWVAVRNCASEETRTPCGFDPGNYGVKTDLSEKYPDLIIHSMDADGSHLDRHFQSLLRYSSQEFEKDRGFQVWGRDENYYEAVLAYVEENGVQCYGGVITASPKTILYLLETGVFSQAEIWDVRIDIG